MHVMVPDMTFKLMLRMVGGPSMGSSRLSPHFSSCWSISLTSSSRAATWPCTSSSSAPVSAFMRVCSFAICDCFLVFCSSLPTLPSRQRKEPSLIQTMNPCCPWERRRGCGLAHGRPWAGLQ